MLKSSNSVICSQVKKAGEMDWSLADGAEIDVCAPENIFGVGMYSVEAAPTVLGKIVPATSQGMDSDEIENMGGDVPLALSAQLDEEAQRAGKRYETRYIYRFTKRIFDICSSLTALFILSPVMVCTAIAIKLEDGGPILYSQKRTSYKEREFDFYKFRSMCVDADKRLAELKDLNEMDGPQFKIKNDPRITKVGKFIRKYSIDEFPQLMNVLKGDISVVGPRPNQSRIAANYSLYARQKYLVKGGLACFRECEGRSDCSFEEWVALDLKYVKECGPLTDLKIIFKTIGAMFTAKGAS